MGGDDTDERIARVLEYIGAHLDEALPIAKLAKVAGISPYHFHRVFRAWVGCPVHEFVSRLRFKRASLLLVANSEMTILETALESGYQAPESFARAFRAHLGQSPTQFREAADWLRWSQAFRSTTNTQRSNMNVEIVEFPTTRVAVFEHCGDPQTLMASVQEFIAWRTSCRDSPEATCRTFGVVFADPDNVPPEEFRFDICGELLGPLAPNPHGVVEKSIAGGLCGRVTHAGSTDLIGTTVMQMIRQWLPTSGFGVRDAPLFFHYVERMPRVPEHEQVTDIYLPLAQP